MELIDEKIRNSIEGCDDPGHLSGMDLQTFELQGVGPFLEPLLQQVILPLAVENENAVLDRVDLLVEIDVLVVLYGLTSALL